MYNSILHFIENDIKEIENLVAPKMKLAYNKGIKRHFTPVSGFQRILTQKIVTFALEGG